MLPNDLKLQKAVISMCQLAPEVNSSSGKLPHIFLHSNRTVTGIHPRVTALRVEYRPVDTASSSSQSDDNSSLTSLQPVVLIWTCRKCAQLGLRCHKRLIETNFKIALVFVVESLFY